MSPVPSLRSTVTVLAAAAVLVGGADIASYAATGHPLLIGKANSGVGTTSLKNQGRGPALSLNSAKTSPPLVVNSSKLVKNLNAAKVGGLTAAQLNPGVFRFHLGHDGGTVPGGGHYVTTKLPPGQYQVSLTGLVESSTTSDGYDCLAGDLNKLLVSDSTGAYLVEENVLSNVNGGAVSQLGTATVHKGETIVLGCEISSSAGLTTDRAFTFLFRPTSVIDKKGTPFNPRTGPTHGALGR